MTDKFIREWEDDKIKITLDLTMRDVKVALGILGTAIKRYTRRREKKAAEGKTFVPEPGRRNVEALTLQRYKDVEAAIRQHVKIMPREDGRIGQLRPKGWTEEDEAQHGKNLSAGLGGHRDD